jgi:hypothetical protein
MRGVGSVRDVSSFLIQTSMVSLGAHEVERSKCFTRLRVRNEHVEQIEPGTRGSTGWRIAVALGRVAYARHSLSVAPICFRTV